MLWKAAISSTIFFLSLASVLAGSSSLTGGRKDYTKYVNPFVGTDAHGHTFPGATIPFGMVQLSPDTRISGWDACGGYHYSDSTIIGFSHTHLSGTGVPDYGDILIMPTVGPLKTHPGDERVRGSGYRSRFRHGSEKASPGYYRVLLDDHNIEAELTASTRVGVHRYTFPKSDTANIIIDLVHGLGPDRVIESYLRLIGDREFEGLRRSEGWAKDQYVYFVGQLSRPFTSFGIVANDTIHPGLRYQTGRNVRGYVGFSTSHNEKILVKVGISAVSVEGARKNLETEVPHWSFDRVRASASELWNNELKKMEVEGGAEAQKRTFYTALYHTMIAPNIFTDVDGRYRGMDGKIHAAESYNMYTVFSLWDTFRAEHPLLTIIDQRRTLDFVKSLIAKYQESGVLPVWELAGNETWTMIGYHSAPVIVDAYMKGIRDFDVATAYQALKNSAELDHYGLRAYREDGYIGGEVESESVSKTLEYAYDDWCIAQMAKSMGFKEHYELFTERGQYYMNLFDPLTSFLRPKINGSWVEPFDPTSVTFHYTEANPWQYTFFVPHDVNGLIDLMGGRARFIQKLDSLFKGSSELAGRKQVDITGLIGQYAQGNEPSHHVAYLYNYAGAAWKTQERVRLIMDSLFTDRPDGLPGNDDCGQMSAWYVLSAIGFYPVCPGQPIYCIGSPIFDKVTINLENGRQFVITTLNNSRQNKYIESAKLNGVPYAKSYLAHHEIVNGGKVEFVMGPGPKKEWGSREEDIPSSFPMDEIVPVPYFVAAGKTFADSLIVTLSCIRPDVDIFYTLGGEIVHEGSLKYSSPIIVRETTAIRAIAIADDGRKSKIAKAEYIRHTPIGRISLRTSYSPHYTGGGDGALVDGLRGPSDFRVGAWQGYEGSDLDAVIDLGSERDITNVSLGCLQDINSWIFFPESVKLSFSQDSISFDSNVTILNDIPPEDGRVMIKEFGREVQGIRARFVRVQAKNIGVCPDWHKGARGKAWLFVDEITVRVR